MSSYESVWEDDETNRKVEFLVNYSFDGEQVTIADITPTKVTFVDPATKAEIRSIGVWTKGGKSLLSRQFRATEQAGELVNAIAASECIGTV